MQDEKQAFSNQNCEIVAVFREEDAEDGIAKSTMKIKATYPLLVDTPATETAAYSQEGYHTYIIGPEGNVLANLPGTKMKRPSPKKILAALANAKQPAGAAN